MRVRGAGWALALLWALAGCAPLGPWAGDSGAGGDEVRVEVSPALLDFGVVPVLTEGERALSFEILNLGEEEVQVTGHDEPLGDPVFVVDAPPVLTVAAGGSVTVGARFLPPGEGAWRADLLVRPSGEVLRLEGQGAAPLIRLGEAALPATVVGCTGEGSVRVHNDGRAALTLASVEVEAAGGAEFEAVGWPEQIGPGEAGEIAVSFRPSGSGDRGAILRVGSDDPLQPLVGAAVSGLGYEGERVEESWRFWPANPTDVLILTDAYGDSRAGDAAAAYVDRLREQDVDYQIAALSGAGACLWHPASADRADTALQAEAVIGRAFGGPGGAWDGALAGLAPEVEAAAAPGGCLEGFLRDGAGLEVLIVSGGPAAVTETEADALLRLAPGARVSALLPQGCGDASAYAGLVARTGGVEEDFCQEDWAGVFAGLAEIPVTDHSVSYPLAQAPVVETVEVEVEGVGWSGWSYDAGGNAIRLDGEPPPLGAEVVIRYVAAVSCGG